MRWKGSDFARQSRDNGTQTSGGNGKMNLFLKRRDEDRGDRFRCKHDIALSVVF